MSLFVRRCLYISFILIFITITPLIIIYASGYKIGNGFRLQKTGAFIVDSAPAGAVIKLNGETQKELFGSIINRESKIIRTPAKIKNLLPGEYTVRLELDGYWPWEKKLSVRPNESTYLEDVVLFKNSLPQIVNQGGYEKIAADKQNKYLAASGDHELAIIDLKTSQSLLTETASVTQPLLWSPSDTKILIGRKIYGISGGSPAWDASEFFSGKVKKIVWGENDNSLYYLNEKDLNKINLEAGSLEKLIDGADIQDFFIKNGDLTYVKNGSASAEMGIIRLSSKKNIFKISLPDASYGFINTDNKLINLLDKNINKLYLIDNSTSINPERDSIENIKQAVWMDENILLYANDFEIWLYDLSSGSEKLLTRISDEIGSIAPYSNLNYVAYATEKNINILELDDRERYNITKLVELDKISGLFVKPDGSSLFFLGNIGQQAGVYKLDLE